ncbi:MAG: sigma-70 family RNA polymerase sigma factor [Chloroflexi bacterium]|nr:sigma-70 family RNA polymerase sigma factor [Chloroflexota bacterium]
MQNEEQGLVERARRKDLEALSRLYEANFVKIYRYIFIRVTDKTEAEDLTQQVFLRVIQSIDSYHWKGLPFSAWLFRIAHNLIIDHVRKRQRGPQFTEYVSQEDPKDRPPEDQAEEWLMMDTVKVALKQLTQLQQEVISLRFAAGLSIMETAQAMGRNEGAIKALQHSALESLRRIMGVKVNNER